MARGRRPQLTAPPEETIPKVLSECQRTSAVHRRSVGLLLQCRRDHSATFCSEFFKFITPALLVYKQEPVVTRTINFVAAFATARDPAGEQDESDDFAEELLGFLLPNTQSRDKALRYRSTQLVARVMELLPEDAGISDETWEEVSEHMQARLRDKQPVIRAKAARALARLVEPGDDGNFEDDPVTSAYKVLLTNDKNTDVRKTVVASYPMVEPLLPDIIERTRDVSDVVRKLTYMALGAKLHVSKLTPQQRLDLLRRGLSDRSPTVRAECVKMVRNHWFVRDCGSDPLALLDLLNVDEEKQEADGRWSHEEMAERVLVELLEGGHVLEKGPSLRDYLRQPQKSGGPTPGRMTPRSTLSPGPASPAPNDDVTSDNDDVGPDGPAVMTPSEALYWRVICQWLHKQAETQGSDAANAGGAQADVMAAEADEKRELLDSFLPATVAEFVELTQMHLAGGEECRFAARQLMALAGCLDLTDAAGRRSAASLVRVLLCGSPNHLDHQNSAPHTPQKTFSQRHPGTPPLDLGGSRKWAHAVSTLARHVHGAPGEYVSTLFAAVQELEEQAERVENTGGEGEVEAAWLRCLAVVGLLLEEVKGLEELREGGAASMEMFEKCVVAQVHHTSPYVRQSAVHALALLCHLDSDLSRQYSPLLCSVAQTDAHPSARVLALKALFDLALRHGPECLNLEKGAEQGPVSGEAGLASGEGSPGSRAESFQSALSSRGTSFRSAVSDAAELMETARSPFPRGRVAQDESNVTSAGVNASSGAKPFETDSLAFLAQFLDPETLETDPGELERRGKRPKSGRGKKGAGEKVARGLEGLGREAVEVAAEGFAKLLLFDRVANAPDALGRLLLLYFDPLTEPCLRLRQCLAVFFDYYAAASAEHKRCISSAFLDVVRLAWAGQSMEGKLTSTAARKKAATLAKFMLQLLDLPPLHQPKPAEPVNLHQDSGDDAASTQTHEPVTQNPAPTEDEGQEQLALNLAAEILGCPDKKSAAGKAYLSMLAKTVAGLTFRRSEQEAVKKMRRLLDWLLEALQFDRTASKELTAMVTRLAELDDTPAEPLSEEALKALEGLAEAHMRAQGEGAAPGIVPGSRARRMSRAGVSRGTVARSSREGVTSDNSDDVTTEKPPAVQRPARQSKTAALTKMGDQKRAAFGGASEDSQDFGDNESEEGGEEEESRDDALKTLGDQKRATLVVSSEDSDGEDSEGGEKEAVIVDEEESADVPITGPQGYVVKVSEGYADEAGLSDQQKSEEEDTPPGGGREGKGAGAARRDSAGSSAGGVRKVGEARLVGKRRPVERKFLEGASEEEGDEPPVVRPESRASTGRVAAPESGTEGSDDAMLLRRPRRSTGRGVSRRVVMEESSDGEVEDDSESDEDGDEGRPIVSSLPAQGRAAVPDTGASPEERENAFASSGGESDVASPVVARRGAGKRRVVIDSESEEASSEGEPGPAHRGGSEKAIGKGHVERSLSRTSSFVSADDDMDVASESD